MSIRKLVVTVSMVLVLLTGLAIFFFVRTYKNVVCEAFTVRSAGYVAAFANATGGWLEGGDAQEVKTAARLLLLGSALYVQVIRGTTVLVDERIQEAGFLNLPQLTSLPTGRILEYRSLGQGPRYLDVIIPTILLNQTGEGRESGYVRIGVDATLIGVRTRSMALIASAGGFGFAVAVIGLFFCVLWRVKKRLSRKQGVWTIDKKPAESLLIEHEALQINATNKRVTLFGKGVSLTPKQYLLLYLLASEPGRVFSDKEILAAVWPESDYADAKDVKQQVYLLRRRLATACADASKVVVNVPGFGYKLVPPAVDEDLTER